MTTGSLTTTQPPNTPVCQTSEHTLNLIHPSMECTFITIAILRLFIIPLLSCFCFHFDLRRYFILLPFCLYRTFTFCATSSKLEIPMVFICPPPRIPINSQSVF